MLPPQLVIGGASLKGSMVGSHAAPRIAGTWEAPVAQVHLEPETSASVLASMFDIDPHVSQAVPLFLGSAIAQVPHLVIALMTTSDSRSSHGAG